MDYSLTTRLAAEFLGTALLVMLGNGAVANVDLRGTKGYGSDWMLIAVGYGWGYDSCNDFWRYQRQSHQPSVYDWFSC